MDETENLLSGAVQDMKKSLLSNNSGSKHNSNGQKQK